MDLDQNESLQRLEQLEIRFSYQEKYLEELNSQVCALQLSLERIEANQRTLSQKLKEITDNDASIMASNVRPPHY